MLRRPFLQGSGKVIIRRRAQHTASRKPSEPGPAITKALESLMTTDSVILDFSFAAGLILRRDLHP